MDETELLVCLDSLFPVRPTERPIIKAAAMATEMRTVFEVRNDTIEDNDEDLFPVAAPDGWIKD